MRPAIRLLPVAFAACFSLLPAQEPGAPSAETRDLVERERVRSTIVNALRDLQLPHDDPRDEQETIERALGSVLALGDDAAPFLVPELEGLDPVRYYFAVRVLGLLGAPEAEAPLRRAIELADKSEGLGTLRRKAYTAYMLGVLGVADAVDALDQGRRPAAHLELVPGLSALEMTALVTAPDCVPFLLAQLDRLRGRELDETQRRDPLLLAVRALRRVGDTAALPKIISLLADGDPSLRAECLKALGELGAGAGPEVVKHLFAGLEDPLPRVRKAAAAALDDLRPAGTVRAFLARLEVEDEPFVRGKMYDTIAEELGLQALTVFRANWGRDNIYDQMALLRAAARIGDPKAVPLIRLGLEHPHNNVKIRAALALQSLGGRAAMDSLLAALRSPSWPLRITAVEALVQESETRAGPRLAGMLLQLARPIPEVSSSRRTRIEKLANALVALAHVEPRTGLRKAAGKLNDRQSAAVLERAAEQLDAIARRKDDIEQWTEALGSEEPDARRLAYRSLGKLGGPPASDALIAAFERADVDEQPAILDALAENPSPRAATLVERLLTAPAFAGPRSAELREHAAWLARRIGGARMGTVLAESARRLEGRDFATLAYLGVLQGADALPLLRELRTRRVRHPSPELADEQDRLGWMMRRLGAGRPVSRFDRAPDRPAL